MLRHTNTAFLVPLLGTPPFLVIALRNVNNALQHLTRRGLTVPAVIANFHRQRVLPLMERRLAIYQLIPKAIPEGSRMSRKLLSHDAAAQRAKSTVAHFPADVTQLWAIKMRLEEGYIQLVSLAFDC